jgi:hypothetical protein
VERRRARSALQKEADRGARPIGRLLFVGGAGCAMIGCEDSKKWPRKGVSDRARKSKKSQLTVSCFGSSRRKVEPKTELLGGATNTNQVKDKRGLLAQMMSSDVKRKYSCRRIHAEISKCCR